MKKPKPNEGKKVSRNGPARTRPRVQSVARAASILLAIARSDNGLTPKEMSSTLGISLQTTYHLLHTLSETGLIARNERNRFVVGLNAGVLAEALTRHLAAPEYLAPVVREIARETGETAYAVGWWNGEIVTLSVTRGHHAVHAAEVPHGFSRDAHARASGKLLLAFATPSVRDDYLRTHALRRCTAHTITTLKAMARECETIRQQGYSIDREELTSGLSCIAVPIAGGLAPFALGLSAPADRFQKEFQRYLTALRRMAAKVPAGGRAL